MFWLVVSIILFIVILLAVVGGLVSKEPAPFGVAGLALVILLVFTGFCSITTVDARAVGVQTGFGKYMNTLDNGFHITAPYSKVEQFSTQVQYLDLDGKQGVPVTFAGGGGGWVGSTVRWRINENQAEDLWAKYKTFDNVRDQLVNASAKDSYRVVMANYGPNDARDGANIRPITEGVQTDLENTLSDDGIIIDSVSVKAVSLDDNSQKSLDRIVSANNDIERARAEQERARIDAETARIRAAEGALTPEALQRYCFEVTNSWNVAQNGPLPATWNCGPSGSVTPVLPIQ